MTKHPTDGRRSADYPLSVAPMMECTDRHFRTMMRKITRHTLLYTEMVTAEAIIRGDRAQLLDFHPDEHPISLQIGGSEPERLAMAAKIGESWGYDEINLNVGCPSSRVQEGSFGACLMAEPALVAECIDAMRNAVQIPVTVKHRIGIDGREDYEDLAHFVETVAQTGCEHYTVHARIAILGGLSPKENRTIPPLRYHDVFRLKQDFPHLWVELNGGVRSLDAVRQHLQEGVDAVMIGRGAYDDPYMFAQADPLIFGKPAPGLSRTEVVEAMIPYIEAFCATGQPLIRISRHMLTLFRGQPGARAWRRILSQNSQRKRADLHSLKQALAAVSNPHKSPTNPPNHTTEPSTPA